MAEAKERLPGCCKLLFSTHVECAHQVVHLGSICAPACYSTLQFKCALKEERQHGAFQEVVRKLKFRRWLKIGRKPVTLYKLPSSQWGLACTLLMVVGDVTALVDLHWLETAAVVVVVVGCWLLLLFVVAAGGGVCPHAPRKACIFV